MIKLPDTEGLQDRVRVAEHTGPGPRLRAAREASGYEIEDIAKQLRLHPHIIHDLERDTFSDHLALVFVRGYLRAYASLIGLDPNQVVDEFNALGFQEDRDLPDLKGKPQARTRMKNQADMSKSSMSPGMKWGAIIAVLVSLGGIFIAYNHEPEVQLNSVPSVVSDSTEPSATGETDDTVTQDNVAAPTVAPAAAAPAPAPAPAPVVAAPPAPAPAPAPAPKPAPQEEDDYYDDGASNDLQLPKPSRSTVQGRLG